MQQHPQERIETRALRLASAAQCFLNNLESFILESHVPEMMVEHATQVRQKRWPEAEEYLYRYASLDLLQRYIQHWPALRCPMLEGRIAREFPVADLVGYARRCVPERWHDAEQRLLGEDLYWQMGYTLSGKRGRWPEGEERIIGTRWQQRYAKEVLHNHWDEEVAKKCACWLYYYAKEIGGRLPDELHNQMIAEGLKDQNNRWVKKYVGTKKYQKVRRTAAIGNKKPPATP